VRVTINALGTQAKIAKTILARGADDLPALKDNQRCLAEEVALYFEIPEQPATPAFETTDADHARIETRRPWVSQDVAWLNADRRAPGAALAGPQGRRHGRGLRPARRQDDQCAARLPLLPSV
jgi:hypothetical protein